MVESVKIRFIQRISIRVTLVMIGIKLRARPVMVPEFAVAINCAELAHE
jgi:hypothetical protein